MEDSYYPNLKLITLNDFEKELESAELLPSRKIIQDDIMNRFALLRGNGMECLNDLLVALKTAAATNSFSKTSGLPVEYLKIMKREISSWHPKPVALIDFPGISKTSLQHLKKYNINNTIQLFAHVRTKKDRTELSKQTGVSYAEILELTKLTDVSRIRWVGATFARLLVDSLTDTVVKVANADYKQLHSKLMKINEEKKYFKGSFGANDMKLCIIAAQKVPDAIIY